MVKILDRGWIQSGDRFIQDQKLFGGAECPRDQNALLLSAGEFPVAFLLQMLNTQSFQIVGCQLPLCPGIKRTVSTAAQVPDSTTSCTVAGKSFWAAVCWGR